MHRAAPIDQCESSLMVNPYLGAKMPIAKNTVYVLFNTLTFFSSYSFGWNHSPGCWKGTR